MPGAYWRPGDSLGAQIKPCASSGPYQAVRIKRSASSGPHQAVRIKRSDQVADAVDHHVRTGPPATDLDLAGGVERADHGVGQILPGGAPVDARVAGPRHVGGEHGDE